MKTLTNYIISTNVYSNLSECLDNDLNIIDEGKLGDTIAKFLGVSDMDKRHILKFGEKIKNLRKILLLHKLFPLQKKIQN